MKKYAIFCDSACDLTKARLDEMKVQSISLSYHFNNLPSDGWRDNSTCDFYTRMRRGETAKTSAANTNDFLTSFESTLCKGYDILYLGFSSALSGTYNAAAKAGQILSIKYPKQKILTVDTLCASAGIALLLQLVLDKQAEGASIEEARDFAENIKLNIAHWFTVDDLQYLKQGGRISPSSAFFGNMIGIKPILHVDNYGRLINTAKVRGRRTSIQTLAEKYKETRDERCGRLIYISHADCLSEAMMLSDSIGESFSETTRLITDISPVIGAHSGPGTLAIFFVAKTR